jgi:tRNA A37 threonylcarbamoyladenosine biosynthesis protein TsaE
MQQNSIRDIQQFSNKIGKIVTNGDVIFLYGEIGTGKTTFARFLINGLEIVHGLKESNVKGRT